MGLTGGAYGQRWEMRFAAETTNRTREQEGQQGKERQPGAEQQYGGAAELLQGGTGPGEAEWQ